MVVLFLIFWGVTVLFFTIAVWFYIPTSNASVQFSRSVVSDSLRPHELQHARPPCPSPTPRRVLFSLHVCQHLLSFDFLTLVILTGMRFWFTFSWLVMLSIFLYICWPFVCILLGSVYSSLLQFLNWFICFFLFVAQLVKSPPAIWETWVWSLGWEDPLEKGKATHSSILAWRIPWTV